MPRRLRSPTKRNPRFLHGVPRLLVLKLLSGREMYGYELVQELQETTEGVLAFAEGVIYPILHELERDGLLRSRRARVSGRVRVYYRTSAKGKRALTKEAEDWRTVVRVVSEVLGDGGSGAALA